MKHRRDLTDPYGILEYAVGSADDFICFDYHVHHNGDVTLHSILNSETGSFIQDMMKPCRVPQAWAVQLAVGMVDEAITWGYDNKVKHSKRGWNQDPWFFAREVALSIAWHNGAPYKRVPRKNGKIPTYVDAGPFPAHCRDDFKGFTESDPCPSCGGKMTLQEGESETQEEPGYPEVVHCAACRFTSSNIDRKCNDSCPGCSKCYTDHWDPRDEIQDENPMPKYDYPTPKEI